MAKTFQVFLQIAVLSNLVSNVLIIKTFIVVWWQTNVLNGVLLIFRGYLRYKKKERSHGERIMFQINISLFLNLNYIILLYFKFMLLHLFTFELICGFTYYILVKNVSLLSAQSDLNYILNSRLYQSMWNDFLKMPHELNDPFSKSFDSFCIERKHFTFIYLTHFCVNCSIRFYQCYRIIAELCSSENWPELLNIIPKNKNVCWFFFVYV